MFGLHLVTHRERTTPSGIARRRLLTIFDKSNTPAFEAGHGIRVLIEDRAGTLWIGAIGSGLVHFSDGRFTKHTEIDLPGLLRANPRYRDTPALAVTVHSMPWETELFEEAGFDGYVTKPFRQQELLDTIAKALSSPTP